MEIVLVVLATIALVRIWNYEQICARLRAWLAVKVRSQIITCPTCNGFWFGVLALAGAPWLDEPLVFAAYSALALFATLRLWLAGSQLAGAAAAALGAAALPRPAAQAPPGHPRPPGRPEPAPQQRAAEIKRVGAFKRRIVLLTSFADFNPSYSLIPVVIDQALMLARNPEWLVQIWVMENTGMCRAPRGLPKNLEIRPIIPVTHWKADTVDEEASKRIATVVQRELIALGNATVITHDLLLIDTHVTFAKAIHDIGQTKAFAWLHQVHSATLERPKGDAARWRCTLPKGHKLISTTEVDVPHLARYYDTDPANVLVVPSTRDISSIRGFQPLSNDIIHRCKLLEADVVQTLPLSATRRMGKGVDHVIDVFAALNRRGLDVRLLIAEAHANDGKAQETMTNLKAYATKLGLPPDEVIFTSETWPQTAVAGLPPEVVGDLMQVSNLFVFPSKSETSSLALKEAALAGNLIVTNSCVEAMEEVVPFAITCPFGGVRDEGKTIDHDALAQQIENFLNHPANLAKRHVLKAFSRTAVESQLVRAVESTPFMGSGPR